MTPRASRPDPGAAAGARDAAARRLRFATAATVAATIALGGVFAAFAAGSTHARKSVSRVVRAATAPALRAAPAPPLVAAQGAGESQQPSSPSSPAPAPAPAYTPPVVVSGGS